MNALAVVPPEPWIKTNLIETLRRHYCESLQVFHYPGGMGQLGSKQWRCSRDQLNDDLLVFARNLKAAGKLDLLFFITYDDFLLVDTAEKLRALDVPMVNYHVDMVFQWYRVIRTAPYFDILAVAQTANAECLKPYASHIEWMPMAANPDFYQMRAAAVSGYRHDVSFLGSFNPYRRALLEACVKNGFNPTIYGQGWRDDPNPAYRFDWDPYKIIHDLRFYGWPRWSAEGVASISDPLRRKLSRRHGFGTLSGGDILGACRNEDLPGIFRSSRVNLGLSDTGWHHQNEVVSSGKLQCRLRDFEVPMAGGFYLVQETSDHRDYYKIGEEIETWSDIGELIDKLSYYSKHEKVAERIRDAGQRRAVGEHTWRHRFDRLFQKLREVGKVRW
jgi:spore maturation protein CgeB